MESDLKPIDLTTWSRASQFGFFRRVQNPHFMISAEVDATRLMSEDKPAGVSLFNAALHAIMYAANAVPELRTRFSGEIVRQYGRVSASVTVPIDGGNFAFCDIPFSPDWPEFAGSCEEIVEAARGQTALVDRVAGEAAWIYLTCLPWIRFTAMSHPVDGPLDCIPRIAWGKISEDGGRWMMPVAIQVHHALVDGHHIGRFFEHLETELQRSRQSPPAAREGTG